MKSEKKESGKRENGGDREIIGRWIDIGDRGEEATSGHQLQLEKALENREK